MAETAEAGMHDIRAQAIDWLLRLEDANSDESVRPAFEQWRLADSRHDKIFQEVSRIWYVAATPTKPRQHKFAAVSVLLLAALLTQLLPWDGWLADARSRGDEIKRIVLEDGSQLVLNGDAAVDIDYDARNRTIRLIHGEVLAEVAHDRAGRPFRIENRDGSATALGTRYLVRQQAEDTVVAVLESRVAVEPHQRPELRVALRAGEQVRMDAHHLGAVKTAPQDSGEWAAARLAFQDTPLEHVIAELNRRQPGALRLMPAPKVMPRFTGMLPANDPQLALSLLEQTLPIHATHTGDQWVVEISR